MTIDFTYLRSAATTAIDLKAEVNTALSAYIAAIRAIDPTAVDAQATLDTIVVEFTNYQATINPALKDSVDAYGVQLAATKILVDSDGTAAEKTEFDAIVKSYSDARIPNTDVYAETKAAKSAAITAAKTTAPQPTVPPPSPVVSGGSGSVSPSTISTSKSGLNSFISNIKKFGVPLASKFEVELPPISNVTDTRPINILCNSASMPEQRISLTQHKIFGESNFLAGGAEFGQLQLTFLVTNKFAVHEYFDDWLEMIYSKNKKTLGFYNNYTKEIAVHNLGRDGKRIFSAYYQDCFPISVQTTGVSYDNNHPLTLNVSFAYRTWSTYTTTNSLIDPEMDPLKLNSSSALRAFDNVTVSNMTERFGGNGVAAASGLGAILGSRALDAANQVAGSVKGLAPGGDSSFGSTLGKYMNQIGTASSMIGAGIGSIGDNLNTILAPAQAIAGGITSLSGVLSATDNLLGRVGIKTNIGSVVGNLNGVAGVLSVTGQLNGIPGALSSLGSVMGSVGGEFANIQKSFSNVPGATKAMTNSIGNLSKVTTDNANTTSAIAGMNFTNPPTGLNNNIINPNNDQVSYAG